MTSWLNTFELWMGLAAAFITFATLPIWRAGCRRSGLIDDPGDRKIHEQPIPLAGGLAILSGLLLPILALPFLGKMGQPEPGVMLRLAALLGGAVAMTLLGLLDDRVELRPVPKFAGQFLVAVAVSAAGLRFHLFPSPLDHVLTVLWILTVTNAFNFTDNMNGLCAGLASLGALGMAVLSSRCGDIDSLVLCVLTAGAALVTWLIYAIYLHARNQRSWAGRPAAMLLVVGFGMVLVTYSGSLWFSGLHAYSGL